MNVDYFIAGAFIKESSAVGLMQFEA